MRLSRPRLLLRALLLLGAAAFMLWRGFDTRAAAAAAAAGLDAAGAQLLGRIALLEWVLGGLALLTGGFALWSARPSRQPEERPRRLPLGLEPPPPPPGSKSA